MGADPLVTPGEPLSAAELERYSRQLLVLGVDGQRRLKNARVLVIGAGGLGSPALLYLAAAGVGTIGIVDPDIVDESNLHRQVIHHTAGIGKVASAAAAITALNPLVTVEQHPYLLTNANARELFSSYDLVIDGSDNFPTRYLVNDAAVLTGTTWVWGSVFQTTAQVAVFDPDLTYRDVYPAPPPQAINCAVGGVLGSLCGTTGTTMGTEAIKLICGFGETLYGRLQVIDALRGTTHTVRVSPDPSTPAITELERGIDADSLRARIAAENGTENGTENRPDEGVGDDEVADGGSARTVLVDVREPVEFAAGHLEGARLLPFSEWPDAADRLPSGSVVLYCETGVRSAAALAMVADRGEDITHLTGGLEAWNRI